MKTQFYILALSFVLAGCAEPAPDSIPLTKDALPPPEPATSAPVAMPEGDAVSSESTGEGGADGFTATASGLKYRITREGTGRKPTASDTVEVHYRGTLDDGTVFDSSYDRGEPISFPLTGVIKGWTEGMQLVGEGGEIELQIPPELGYGAGGTGPIPPNAQLHFTVELLSIK